MSEKLDVRRLLEKYKEWVDNKEIKFLKNSADKEKISKQVEELSDVNYKFHLMTIILTVIQ